MITLTASKHVDEYMLMTMKDPSHFWNYVASNLLHDLGEQVMRAVIENGTCTIEVEAQIKESAYHYRRECSVIAKLTPVGDRPNVKVSPVIHVEITPDMIEEPVRQLKGGIL